MDTEEGDSSGPEPLFVRGSGVLHGFTIWLINHFARAKAHLRRLRTGAVYSQISCLSVSGHGQAYRITDIDIERKGF